MKFRSKLTLALSFMVLANCGGTSTIRYFSLSELQDYPQFDESSKYALTVGVKYFDSGLMYHDDRIIYRESDSHEIKYWNYARWITTPNILLAEKLKSSLAKTNLFHHVVDSPINVRTDLIIEGKIFAFEEVDGNSKWSTQVGLEFKVYTPKDKLQSIFRYSESTPVGEKSPDGVVFSFDSGAKKCISRFTKDLDEWLLAQKTDQN